MVAAKQNQKFPFHFLSSPPPPPAEEKKKGKENFWFLLPRPQGADEARRLVISRISLKKRSDFVQETQPFCSSSISDSASSSGSSGMKAKRRAWCASRRILRLLERMRGLLASDIFLSVSSSLYSGSFSALPANSL